MSEPERRDSGLTPGHNMEFEAWLVFQAWKVEQERLKKEEEEEEKSKKTKNEPKGKQPKQADAKKGSTTSAAQKKGAEPVPEAPQEERAGPLPEQVPAAPPPRSRAAAPPPRSSSAPPPDVCPGLQVFVGLSTGGMLIHVSGRVQHLRPAGGGVVRVEDIRYAEGLESPDKRLRVRGRQRLLLLLRSFPAADGGGGEGRPSLLHPHPPSWSPAGEA